MRHGAPQTRAGGRGLRECSPRPLYGLSKGRNRRRGFTFFLGRRGTLSPVGAVLPRKDLGSTSPLYRPCPKSERTGLTPTTRVPSRRGRPPPSLRPPLDPSRDVGRGRVSGSVGVRA